MNYHPDNKQLIDFAAKSLKKKSYEAVALHISDCEECRSTVNSLRAILKESDNSTLAPPPRIKSRILGLMDEAGSKTYSSIPLRSGVRILLRPVVYASVVVIAALSIFIYISQKSSVVSDEAMLTLSQHKGEVLYNDSILQKKDVKPGILKTKEYSSAVLSLESVLSIQIAGNSELSIINAQKNAEKNNIEYIIALDMRNGNILASSDHNIKKNFTISTKHAVFEALGTSFILSSDDIISKLSVLDGAVRATSKADGKLILITKGEGCTVSDIILQKTNINPENENKIFLNIFNKEKPEKFTLPDKGIESKDTEQEKNILSSDDNVRLKEKETITDELKKSKEEMRNEGRQIQKEMRSNMKSGKKSQ